MTEETDGGIRWLGWQNQIPSRLIFRVFLPLPRHRSSERKLPRDPFSLSSNLFLAAPSSVRPPSDTFGEANYTVLFCEREGGRDDDEINLYSRDAL